MWNVATGECYQVLEGHNNHVGALAVCCSRLASICWNDRSIKVWGMGAGAGWVDQGVGNGAGAGWARERSLVSHTGAVLSLVGWQDKVASSLGDGSIRVWDVGTGAHDATLACHLGAVTALLVHWIVS